MVVLPCAEVAVIRYASLTKRKRKRRNRKNEKSHLMKRRIVFA
jgi:hypothetical protein